MTSFATAVAKDVTVEAEDNYPAPYTMSPAEARHNAIEYVRFVALRQAFGEIMGSENTIIDTHNGDETQTFAYSRSESETNGEWIKDLIDPVIVSETQDKFGTMYRVRVKGLARRIEHIPIDIDCRLLCNGTDKDRDRLRGGEYYDGDNFYVYFSSPEAGYLAIYIEDDDDYSNATMQAILPYDGQNVKAYPIAADSEYVFFSLANAEESVVDYAGGLKMYARKKVDINRVHIIFSPNEFSRSSTEENRRAERTARIAGEEVNLMPRETTYKNFKKWLSKARKRDPRMQYRKIPFYIKKHS